MINIDWNAFIKLPYWLAKPLSELDKFRVGCIAFWQRLNEILAWPGAQLDPMTAELALVHLLAWERDIEQIPQETEQLYRIRVKYALKFAKGAGSIDGWHFMFKKLGVQWINIGERLSQTDWDIIDLQLLDSDLASRQALIDYICRKYGRTTRRYQLSTMARMALNQSCTTFDYEQNLNLAVENTSLLTAKKLIAMDNQSSYQIAKTEQGNL
jgi:hypothetical protein